MKGKLIAVLAFFPLSITLAQGQDVSDFTGTWKYQVIDTPYGNFYGDLILEKVDDQYDGKFVNDKGREFSLTVLRVKGNKMIISSDIEETDSMLNCTFDGDQLKATVEVQGDDFLYKLEAKRATP